MDFQQFFRIGSDEFFVTGQYWSRMIDKSFSHLFGVERRYREEVYEIKISRAAKITIDGEEQTEMSVEQIDAIKNEIEESING